MAKQKSGLGKGLGALFNDAASYSSKSDDVEGKVAAPTAKPNAKSSKKESVRSFESKGESSRKEEAADIYISEDALENAKVVEREARPPKQKEATTTKKSSSSKRPAPVAASRSIPKKRAAESGSATQSANKANTNPSNRVAPLKQPPTASASQTSKTEEKGAVGEVLLTQIQPNPDQPRTNFKPEEIEELANSIMRDGLLQPILVRRMGDHYEIIAGERRWQACRSLGMETVPVRFWTADEGKALELALIENIQRADLNPIEEAYGYKRLMERKGMTQSEVAQTVSKGRSTIANALRLLDLPEEAQQLLFEEKISAGHARAILSVPTAEGRKSLTNKLMEEKLSVRETEAIARLLAGREKAKETPSSRTPVPPSFKKAARNMSKILSLPVRVKAVQGKNKIEIQFKDEEELQRVVAALAE